MAASEIERQFDVLQRDLTEMTLILDRLGGARNNGARSSPRYARRHSPRSHASPGPSLDSCMRAMEASLARLMHCCSDSSDGESVTRRGRTYGSSSSPRRRRYRSMSTRLSSADRIFSSDLSSSSDDLTPSEDDEVRWSASDACEPVYARVEGADFERPILSAEERSSDSADDGERKEGGQERTEVAIDSDLSLDELRSRESAPSSDSWVSDDEQASDDWLSASGGATLASGIESREMNADDWDEALESLERSIDDW
jgi:hypothetical protein